MNKNVAKEIDLVIGEAISADKLNDLGFILQRSSGDGLAMIIIVGGDENKMSEIVIAGPDAMHLKAASVLEHLAKRLREGLGQGHRVSPHGGN